jgi:hypothetical protein
MHALCNHYYGSPAGQMVNAPVILSHVLRLHWKTGRIDDLSIDHLVLSDFSSVREVRTGSLRNRDQANTLSLY